MKRFLLNTISFKTIQVLSICHPSEANQKYELLKVVKKKNQLEIKSTSIGESFEQIKSLISENQPLIVLIKGKGVINKRLDPKADQDQLWLKTIDLSKMYYTKFKSNPFEFISISRKEVVDPFIKKIKSSRLPIVDLYVGEFSTGLLINQLSEQVLRLDCVELKIDSQKLLDFSVLDDKEDQLVEYKFGEESVNASILPLFGACLNYVVSDQSIEKTFFGDNEKNELFFKRLFNLVGGTVLVAFLLSLTVSYFMINHYGQEIGRLEYIKQTNANFSQKIEKLKKDNQVKREIIRSSGLMSNHFLSYYSYHLLNSIPKEIQLKTLSINPILKKVKVNKVIEFDKNSVIIEGYFKDEVSFTNWLDIIRNFQWIDHFEIDRIEKDRQQNSFFTIKIYLSDV